MKEQITFIKTSINQRQTLTLEYFDCQGIEILIESVYATISKQLTKNVYISIYHYRVKKEE